VKAFGGRQPAPYGISGEVYVGQVYSRRKSV